MAKPQLIKQEFASGLNTMQAPNAIKSSETHDGRNDDTSEGIIKTRPGVARQATSALAGGRIFSGIVLETESGTKYEFARHSTSIVTI